MQLPNAFSIYDARAGETAARLTAAFDTDRLPRAEHEIENARIHHLTTCWHKRTSATISAYVAVNLVIKNHVIKNFADPSVFEVFEWNMFALPLRSHRTLNY